MLMRQCSLIIRRKYPQKLFYLPVVVLQGGLVRHSVPSSKVTKTFRFQYHNSALTSLKESLDFPTATHAIEDLREKELPLGLPVVLHGYLGERTDVSKNLSFALLSSTNQSLSIQILSSIRSGDEASFETHHTLKSVRPNSPVVIEGTLKSRVPPKQQGWDDLKIKSLEIQLDRITSLNAFPRDIILTQDTQFPPEQRHLQLRSNQPLRDSLTFRADVMERCRRILRDEKFVDVETPLLFKSTSEGAREFVVPTRRSGYAYALPQSPQQYKQILMGSGIPRYYQFAKCFRDEDLRADRQPEFTQLDLEMSFANGNDVMYLAEKLLKDLWSSLMGLTLTDFPRMTYFEAMSKYGSDKPDLRFGSEINPVQHFIPVDLTSKISPLTSPIVEVFKMSIAEDPKQTRKFVTDFMDSVDAKPFLDNPDGGPGVFIYDTRQPLQGLQPFGFEAAEVMEEKLQIEDGDLVVLQARKDRPFAGGSTMIGNLRNALYNRAVIGGLQQEPSEFKFVWITDFPLFSPIDKNEPGQRGEAGLQSTHHPFTAPKTVADVDLLMTDPLRVTADHYDLVLNGVELGGGSRRIHNAAAQEFVLREILKMPDDRIAEFSHLLEVLRAGCPPHAGIAFGFDRLVAVMLGKQSIRDVIAFPKSGKGEDLLVRSPGSLTQEALAQYHLKLAKSIDQ